MAADTAVRTIGLIIVGDEILSGRRADKHFAKVIDLLAARGLQLSWVEILGDDRQRLTATYQRSFARGDVVFSCGGIGATPDDHTRQAVAAALDVELALHPQAAQYIAQHCANLARQGKGSADMNTAENQQRLQMGVFPAGSDIVPNPYNGIPGFYLRDHTFVPGFPVMAWPMLEWTLDTRYRALHHAVRRVEYSFLVYGLPESRLTPAMEAVQQRWSEIKTFSLPSLGEHAQPYIDLGVKGEPEAAAWALEFLQAEVIRLGGRLTPGADLKG